MLGNDVLTMLALNIFRMFLENVSYLLREHSGNKIKLPAKNIVRMLGNNILTMLSKTFFECFLENIYYLLREHSGNKNKTC